MNFHEKISRRDSVQLWHTWALVQILAIDGVRIFFFCCKRFELRASVELKHTRGKCRWRCRKEDNGESGTVELTIDIVLVYHGTTNKLRRYNCFIRFWFLFSKVYITLMGFSFIGVWVYSNLLKMFNFLLDHFVD